MRYGGLYGEEEIPNPYDEESPKTFPFIVKSKMSSDPHKDTLLAREHERDLASIRLEFENGFRHLTSQIAELKKDIRTLTESRFKEVEAIGELRSDIKGELGDFKAKVNMDLGEIRGEVKRLSPMHDNVLQLSARFQGFEAQLGGMFKDIRDVKFDAEQPRKWIMTGAGKIVMWVLTAILAWAFGTLTSASSNNRNGHDYTQR